MTAKGVCTRCACVVLVGLGVLALAALPVGQAAGEVVEFEVGAVPNRTPSNVIFANPVFNFNHPSVGPTSRLVTIFSDPDGLTDFVNANPTATSRFAYDTDSPVLSVSSSGRTEYDATQLQVTFTDPETGELVTLSSNAPSANVTNDNLSSGSDSLGVRYQFPIDRDPVEGEIPFSTYSIANQNPQTVAFDMVPVPGAFAGGLVLMGVMGARRLRRVRG